MPSFYYEAGAESVGLGLECVAQGKSDEVMFPDGSSAMAIPVSLPLPANVSVKRRLPLGSIFETKTVAPPHHDNT